jgi:hypothetical protein
LAHAGSDLPLVFGRDKQTLRNHGTIRLRDPNRNKHVWRCKDFRMTKGSTDHRDRGDSFSTPHTLESSLHIQLDNGHDSPRTSPLHPHFLLDMILVTELPS